MLRREDDDGNDDEVVHATAPNNPRLLLSPLESLDFRSVLFRSVLVRLPFYNVLKLRSVCRSWQETLSSYDFWYLWFQFNPNPNPISNLNPNPNEISPPNSALNPNRRLPSALNPHQNQNQGLQLIANHQQFNDYVQPIIINRIQNVFPSALNPHQNQNQGLQLIANHQQFNDYAQPIIINHIQSAHNASVIHNNNGNGYLILVPHNQNVNPNPTLRNALQNRNPYRMQHAIANPNLIQNPNPYPIHNNLIQAPNPNPIQRNANPAVQHFQILARILSNFNPNPNGRAIPCLLLCSAEVKASPGCWALQNAVLYVQQNAAPSQRFPHYWHRLHKSFMPEQDPYIILACDGGLLLLAVRREGSQQLIVCNPLLRAKKVLPHPIFPLLTDITATPTGFIADKERGEYRVLLSGGVGCQVYHSSTDKWQPIPETRFEGPMSASPPMLDGSIFWLSAQQMSTNSNYNAANLSVYHLRESVVTRVSTYFPEGVYFSNRGYVWKDAVHGLQTLAGDSIRFRTWKLDNALWKRVRSLGSHTHNNVNAADFDCVKVDNLLFIRISKFNQVGIYDFGLNIWCCTPCCDDSECLTGHCVFQPSCMQA